MKLRIKFRKYGSIRFIGHLDVMRFFQKANRRAELDVAYTGGFSPHQIMSFAAPLGVGLTSNGEYMDLEVHSLTSCEDVKQRLNAASVPGIEITSVKILPDKAGNAMASVAAALKTDDHIGVLRQNVGDLTLSFIAPVGAYDRTYHAKTSKSVKTAKYGRKRPASAVNLF